jgi:hypothetical protein
MPIPAPRSSGALRQDSDEAGHRSTGSSARNVTAAGVAGPIVVGCASWAGLRDTMRVCIHSGRSHRTRGVPFPWSTCVKPGVDYGGDADGAGSRLASSWRCKRRGVHGERGDRRMRLVCRTTSAIFAEVEYRNEPALVEVDTTDMAR